MGLLFGGVGVGGRAHPFESLPCGHGRLEVPREVARQEVITKAAARKASGEVPCKVSSEIAREEKCHDLAIQNPNAPCGAHTAAPRFYS